MLQNLLQFLRSYQWYEVIIEVAIIWVCVYFVFRFLRGTRGAGVIKGFAVLLVIVTAAIQILGKSSGAFARLQFLYEWLISLLAVLLIVVFQPELRQAMVRLGHARIFRGTRRGVGPLVEEIDLAVQFLSRNQFGALIAVERGMQLGGLVEGGETIDARVSSRLLESIFWPNSPLHDLGVVIRDDRIVAANVQFPLIEEGSVATRYGSRHRAAAGLSVETDCIVVIVSEETGAVSLSERGLIETVDRDAFASTLAERLEARVEPPPDSAAAEEEPSQEAKDAA
ncbi:MAG: diadenylate cyclase [Planctomycetota bacterium]